MSLDTMTLALAKAYTDQHGGGGGTSAPDWNENNEANPGYIKNRTHYDSRTEGVLLSSAVENVDLSGLIKISDEVMTLDKLEMSRIEMSLSVNSINFNNAIFYYDGYINPSESVLGVYYHNEDVHMDLVIMVFSTTQADGSTPGMYLGIDENGTGTYSMKLYGEVGELKTLDPKYIKDMYYAEDGEIEAYPETELTTETYNTTDTSYIINFVDKTLYHRFDGVIYKCTVTGIQGQYDVVSEDGTELPFEIRFNPSSTSTQCYIKSSAPFPHTIKAFSIGEIIHPIDIKYLPDEIYTTIDSKKMDNFNPTGTGSFSLNRKADTAIGKESFAEGSDTTASGNYSHAEGFDTTASGSSSHAEGQKTTASGVYSHAEGLNTTASNFYSHAEGQNSTASGYGTHAEGTSTNASGSGSHAEGSNTIASGNNSHAEGKKATASGDNSHAEGSSLNLFSSIVTMTNPTNDDIITAWENDEFSLAKGNSSHVEGEDSLALGDCSHAEGSITIASGNNSHAEGSSTTASGHSSHAAGTNTTASGSGSHAEGEGTTASGRSSHAEGSDTVANSVYSLVIGECNAYDESEFGQNVTETTKDCSGSHYFGTEFNFSGTTGEFTISGGVTTDDVEVAFDQGKIYMSSDYNASKESDNGYVDSTIYKLVSVENLATLTYNVEKITSVRRAESRATLDNVFTIGNGTTIFDRSNAATVDWSGNAWYAGDVYVGSTSGTNKDEGSKKLATEEYVTSLIDTKLGAIENGTY